MDGIQGIYSVTPVCKHDRYTKQTVANCYVLLDLTASHECSMERMVSVSGNNTDEMQVEGLAEN